MPLAKVKTLRSWRATLFNLLDSEQSPEVIIAWLCAAFNVQRDEVVRAWNEMLCSKHGI